jgi:pyruvate-formate lyase
MKNGTLRGLMISSATHQYEGMVVGATPDGRLAGTPVSNGMSPSNAMEKNGLTAALISGATTASIPLGDGSSFNITFNPSLLKGDEQLDKFTSMVEGYLSLGGRQLNPNPVSIETLVDAQKNPGNYPELQVKVSGYSARFIDIHKSLQDDIIKRTGFEAC